MAICNCTDKFAAIDNFAGGSSKLELEPSSERHFQSRSVDLVFHQHLLWSTESAAVDVIRSSTSATLALANLYPLPLSPDTISTRWTSSGPRLTYDSVPSRLLAFIVQPRSVTQAPPVLSPSPPYLVPRYYFHKDGLRVFKNGCRGQAFSPAECQNREADSRRQEDRRSDSQDITTWYVPGIHNTFGQLTWCCH